MIYDVSCKKELDNLKNWLLASFKTDGFDIVHNNKKVHVKLDDEGYINISKASSRWDSRYYDYYKKEIISFLSLELFLNPNVYCVSKTLPNTFNFYDKRNDSAFSITDGILNRSPNNAESIKIDGREHFLIGIKNISEDYVLTEEDLKTIENTDISPESFRKQAIAYFKNKPMTRHIRKQVLWSFGGWHYKYFFKCEKCQRDSMLWRKASTSSYIDYFGKELCEECRNGK